MPLVQKLLEQERTASRLRQGLSERPDEISHKINVLENKDLIYLDFEGKTAKKLSTMRQKLEMDSL